MKTLNFNHAEISQSDYSNYRFETKSNVHWSLILLMSCLLILIALFSAKAGNGKDPKANDTFQFQNAVDVTVAPNKNVYVTGYKNLIGNNTEIVTQAYNAEGVLLNEVANNGNERQLYNDQPFKILSDNNSNVYVCGHEYVDDVYGYDVVLIKYNANLKLQWKYVFNNSEHFPDEARGMALDGLGNICIAGMQREYTNRSKVFIYKLSTYGGLIYSTNMPFDAENKIENVNGLIADSVGNVYICGKAYNKVQASSFYTARFNTSGKLEWKRFKDCVKSRYNDEGKALTFDSYGNIIVTGTSELDAKTTVPMVVKYNVNGIETWCYSYRNHAVGRETALKITADKGGNVYFATSYSTASISAEHFTLYKINSWGTQTWARNYDGNFKDIKINRDTVLFAAGSIGVDAAVMYSISTHNGAKIQTAKYIPSKSSDRENASATYLSLACNPTGDVVIACGNTELCGETDYCESEWLMQCYSSKCSGFNKAFVRVKTSQNNK